MKKHEIGAKVILGAFLVVICFSWMIWALVYPFTDQTNYENRELSPFPTLSLENYKNISTEFTNFFNDRIPFRSALITLNNGLDFFIANQSSNPNVIKGEDGWLFYTNVEEGDPIGSYQGTNAYTVEELAAIAANCEAQAAFVEAQGKEFVIFIAPNKCRIYSEYLPKKYGEAAEVYRAKQVYDYLKANTSVRVVYPYEELMEAKDYVSDSIYYRCDTHWNQLGGYIGAAALLKELGIDLPRLGESGVTYISTLEHEGDLARMLGLTKQLQDADMDYWVSGYPLNGMIQYEGDLTERFVYSAPEGDPRSFYMIRDSFGEAMTEYLGAEFSTTVVRYANTYSYDELQSVNPDIVVFETVERFVERLGTFSLEDSIIE